MIYDHHEPVAQHRLTRSGDDAFCLSQATHPGLVGADKEVSLGGGNELLGKYIAAGEVVVNVDAVFLLKTVADFAHDIVQTCRRKHHQLR